ncbi:hypothetical protein BT69DRAFT_1355701 [Atractiella rhizophila]|nr:hypothetical protein BT69DRAFT_1355701 [Atractiella rhizophila]
MDRATTRSANADDLQGPQMLSMLDEAKEDVKNDPSFCMIYNRLEAEGSLDELVTLWLEDSKQAYQESVFGMGSRDGKLEFLRKSLKFVIDDMCTHFPEAGVSRRITEGWDINFDAHDVGIAVRLANLALGCRAKVDELGGYAAQALLGIGSFRDAWNADFPMDHTFDTSSKTKPPCWEYLPTSIVQLRTLKGSRTLDLLPPSDRVAINQAALKPLGPMLKTRKIFKDSYERAIGEELRKYCMSLPVAQSCRQILMDPQVSLQIFNDSGPPLTISQIVAYFVLRGIQELGIDADPEKLDAFVIPAVAACCQARWAFHCNVWASYAQFHPTKKARVRLAPRINPMPALEEGNVDEVGN